MYEFQIPPSLLLKIEEKKMEQAENQISPIGTTQEPSKSKKFWLIVLVAVILVLLAAGACGAYFCWYTPKYVKKACTMEAKLCPDGSSVGRTGSNCEFAQCPGVSPSASTDPTAGWHVYTSVSQNYSFKYPNDYTTPKESGDYLSFFSPLNPVRDKSGGLQGNELKIEIVTEAGKENDTPFKCWNDHNSGEGKTIDQSSAVVGGINTLILTWEGIGTGQFICINYGGKRYLINKYPAETTRQVEYNQILSTFKFTDSTAGWQTYENKNGGYNFRYPINWKAMTNQYNPNNSLFGPEVNSGSGLGGVEISSDQKSIDTFLNSVAAQYTNRTNVTVDGIAGIKTNFKGPGDISGQEVVLFKSGAIYNIYFNSQSSENTIFFDKIVSSFKFTK